ncbi:hypothetical protein LguiA_030723 [Lonicera macranthoides]
MNAMNHMRIPATIPHPPPITTPPLYHLTLPPQNHPPPPKNHHHQNHFSTLYQNPHHSQPQNQFPMADLAIFLHKMVEGQAIHHQQMTQLIHSFIPAATDPQLLHCTVPSIPVAVSADSANSMQKMGSSTVQLVTAGIDLVRPQIQEFNSSKDQQSHAFYNTISGIPGPNDPQTNPTVFQNQTSLLPNSLTAALLDLTAQCNVQFVSAASGTSAPTVSQGSRPAFSIDSPTFSPGSKSVLYVTSTQPPLPHIFSQPFAPSIPTTTVQSVPVATGAQGSLQNFHKNTTNFSSAPIEAFAHRNKAHVVLNDPVIPASKSVHSTKTGNAAIISAAHIADDTNPLNTNNTSIQDNVLAPLLSTIQFGSKTDEQNYSPSVFSANSTQHTSSPFVESIVPCSLNKNKPSSTKNPSTNNSSSFYQSTPIQSVNRPLTNTHGSKYTVPYLLHYTRTRVSNKFSPLKEYLLDDDGDGEAWDQSSEANSQENQEMVNSPTSSENFFAVHRPPSLNVEEALNWGNMADEEPSPLWEARADLAFETALAKNNNNEDCIQFLQNDRSSILNQHFPPLEGNISLPSIQQNSHLPAS